MPWFSKSDARKGLEAKLKEYIPQRNRKKAFRSCSIRCDGSRASVSVKVRRPMNGDDISNVVKFFQDQLGEDFPVNLDEIYQDKSGIFGYWNPRGEITDARMGGRHDYRVDYDSVTGMLTFQLAGKSESKICDVYLQVTSAQVVSPTGDAEHDLAPLLKALSAYADRKQ